MELFTTFLISIVVILIVSLIKRHFSASNKPIDKQHLEAAPVQGQECQDDDSCGINCSCLTTNGKEEKTAKKTAIIYGTQTGTAKEWAYVMQQKFEEKRMKSEVLDFAAMDPDSIPQFSTLIWIISTYAEGNPPDSCVANFTYLKDLSLDFRVDKDFYAHLQYAVFGIGNSVYGKSFNATAKELDRILHRLSATRLTAVGLGDNGAAAEIADSFHDWTAALFKALQSTAATSTVRMSNNKKTAPTAAKDSTQQQDNDESDEEDSAEPLVDLEDIGNMMNGNNTNNKKKRVNLKKKHKKQPVQPAPTDDEDDDEDEDDIDIAADNGTAEKEMLTPTLRSALSKQGYKLLGSHSGVKMCRWTKSMLRGRGGCYKHSFYGIQSHQCMEMTPSLACANKCVFCWRHHKNPVGTHWKWKVDAPEVLIEQALQNHQQLIKSMRGVPGVDKERFEEAFTVRHCALSLVGEPIIYPYINEFMQLLHSKQISSFLVTNAQFPEKMREVTAVTQLYVSIDAATKESLKSIDRPIFSDFWERFLSSLDELALKKFRTVFRLTLVKGWNTEEVYNYAELIKRGAPSFIEVKGVTYCGTSKASPLTMKNVPFHEEVLKFGEELCNSTPYLRDNYELACEHEHSCCLLIAHKKFKVEGKWRTWIDYPKFHALVQSGETFDALDYAAETPSWAVVGAQEHGFDPNETKFKRNKPYQGAGC